MKYYKIVKKQVKNPKKPYIKEIIINKKPVFPRIMFWKSLIRKLTK